MKPAWSRLKSWGCCAFALLAAMLCRPALAAPITCSVSIPTQITGVAYDPFFAAPYSAAYTVNVTCQYSDGKKESKDNAINPVPTLEVNDGLYLSGGTRRAASGSNYLNYALFQGDNSTAWGTTSKISVPITILKNNVSATVSVTFYFRLPEKQNAAVGTYTDSATVTLRYPSDSAGSTLNAPPATAVLNPSVTIAPSCTLSSTPKDLTFTYTSFQTSQAEASTSFAAKCVKDTSYTMALDATSGTLLGLNYSLAISPTGQRTGSGVDQSVTIGGTIAAGQSGICATSSCTASQARTFTITY